MVVDPAGAVNAVTNPARAQIRRQAQQANSSRAGAGSSQGGRAGAGSK